VIRNHTLLGKIIEQPRLRKIVYESSLGFGSQLGVRKVLAPHNVRPKTVPLIK